MHIHKQARSHTYIHTYLQTQSYVQICKTKQLTTIIIQVISIILGREFPFT